MRVWVSFLLFWIFWGADISRAAELYYPGTFDPFHNTHFNEVMAEIKKDPNLKVNILPIERPYYNKRFGEYRPLFLPYEEKLGILKDTFRDQPNVGISDSMRSIDKNVFQTLLKAFGASTDPDKRILIGTDVFALWKDEPGFDELKSHAKIIVSVDVNDVNLSAALAKKFANDPRVTFVRNDAQGLRSSFVTKLLIQNQQEEAFALLPKSYRDHYSEPKKLGALIADYKRRQVGWEKMLLKNETIPLLWSGGVNPDILEALQGSDTLQEAFFSLDPKDKIGINRFVGQVDAVVPGGLDQDSTARQLRQILNSKPYQSLESTQHFAYVRGLFSGYSPPAGGAALPPNAINPPRFLFHWTNQEKLELMDKYNPDKTKLPLRFLKTSQHVVREHPDLAAKPGLYAWSNPVTGMAASSTEAYVWGNGKLPPRLLVMEIKPDAKVLELTTHVDSIKPIPTPDLNRYDLAFNRAYDSKGNLRYSDWIVLKPEAAKRFSADPHVMQAFFRSELKRLEDPNFQYKADQLFLQNFKDKEVWKTNIKAYLGASSAEEIPPALRQPMDVDVESASWGALPPAKDCSRLFEKVSR